MKKTNIKKSIEESENKKKGFDQVLRRKRRDKYIMYSTATTKCHL